MLRNGLIFLSESRAAKKLVTGTALRGMSCRFVPGDTVDELVSAIKDANDRGLAVTANYLGEGEKNEATARQAGDRYTAILDRIGEDGLNANVSMKFTQLGQAISDEFLADNLGRVLDRAQGLEVFIRFDMESFDYTERTLAAFEEVWGSGRRNIGVVLQAYLRRSALDVARMNELGARVRLCKGAYAEPAEVAFQEHSEVDGSFVNLMQMLLKDGTYPAIATHDEAMVEATVAYAKQHRIGPDRFEFQMLYGVRRDLQASLVKDGYNVRVYIPFGEAWYPYLMRRLAERPANLLFMTGSVVRESPLGFLLPKGEGKNGA